MALNCWLGEWREVGTMKEVVSLISKDFKGKKASVHHTGYRCDGC